MALSSAIDMQESIDDFLFTTLSTKLYEGTVGDNFEAVFVDTLGFIPSLARFILS
ncbi:unnamed protein product [Oikopleura dioica]|uniref:Uncharacterized protein n=1 Tax=Oikopleura dioica TaxID=34765 RepID=E4YQR9_OIKDI|nr:unnamed protein product [Oikopleura dioica]